MRALPAPLPPLRAVHIAQRPRHAAARARPGAMCQQAPEGICMRPFFPAPRHVRSQPHARASSFCQLCPSSRGRPAQAPAACRPRSGGAQAAAAARLPCSPTAAAGAAVHGGCGVVDAADVGAGARRGALRRACRRGAAALHGAGARRVRLRGCEEGRRVSGGRQEEATWAHARAQRSAQTASLLRVRCAAQKQKQRTVKMVWKLHAREAQRRSTDRVHKTRRVSAKRNARSGARRDAAQ